MSAQFHVERSGSMSQQGSIIVVSDGGNRDIHDALSGVKTFPMIDVAWSDAADAVARLRPAAVLVTETLANETALDDMLRQIDGIVPYTPLIAFDPHGNTLHQAIPFAPSGTKPDRLTARLNAALRVRSLHATVMRRIADNPRLTLPDGDPLHDATALLIGRGGSFPSLSVALGEQMGVVGALSIEAAAKHLNARDIDGVIVAEGFSARVIDAFLIVLSEDARFRNLPVLLSSSVGLVVDYDLPNLEVADNDCIATRALPLIRQHAFESRLNRLMKSIDAGGMLDPRTGLLTETAFQRDFDAAMADTHERGAGLSVVRMTLDSVTERHCLDAARIVGRLMRRMDFAMLDSDGAILIVLAETGSRDAHLIAKRITSVLKQTVTGPRGAPRIDPRIAVASLCADDTSQTILARLEDHAQRAAS